ncbi:MAG: iron-containing alcohol dehydrogenase [Candidatus Heimdallarchaeota archaeon]|nr:iron-containing alcohol dehydrogenase [Candidatus Heimdallarchaeota archaeon]
MVQYCNPVEVLYGTGSSKQIATYVNKYSSSNRVLIVSGRKSMREQGIIQRISEDLTIENFDVSTYEEIMSNPTIEQIDNAISFVRKNNFGIIIGLGGGSVLDSAKIMAILGNKQRSIKEYLAGNIEIEEDGIPFLAIPTTSGTGSEVTMWATIWEMSPTIKKKHSLSHKKMYAKIAIIDPSLTIGVSPKQTAMSGLDALSQAIEAYWSKNHNPTSDEHARNAIALIFDSLFDCYTNPDNIVLREKVSLGSLESGLAFSNTKTTAVHSVSYPLTFHFGVPHGLACALTLGSFLEYNSEICKDNTKEAPERTLEIAKLLHSDTVIGAKDKITQLMKKMNLPIRLSELNINDEGVELIITEAFTEGRIDNNPRKVTKENLKILLNSII